jgi:hypothetical protein
MNAPVADWLGYRPADFVPYTTDVWFSLIERVGEDFWPLHVAALGIGLSMAWLLRTGRGPVALLLLAAVWAWVGWAFLIQRYSVLNWAGGLAGWMFMAQAAVLALAAAGWRWYGDRRQRLHWTGLALVALGLLAVPIVTAVAGGSLLRAEAFGLHPDPTVIVTIGIVLCSLRPAAQAAALLIPGLWCVLSALHLQVLGVWWWPLMLASALCAVAVPIAQVWRGARTTAR